MPYRDNNQLPDGVKIIYLLTHKIYTKKLITAPTKSIKIQKTDRTIVIEKKQHIRLRGAQLKTNIKKTMMVAGTRIRS